MDHYTTFIFRVSCCLAFQLIVNCCVAQNIPSPDNSLKSYNNIFDTLVAKDTSIPVTEYTRSWPAPQKQGGDILKQRLDDKEYTDEEKFWYFNSLNNDTVHYISEAISDSIKRWRYNLAVKIIETYFNQDWDRDGDSWYAIVNTIPLTSKLLEDYISKWPTIAEKKRHEERVFYWLIKSGKEEAALNLLKSLVADYVAGKDALYTGDRYYNANLFDLLCFSKNNVIRSEAIKLLWTCLDYKLDDRLLDLGLYLDESIAITYLKKWFWYYASQKLAPPPPRIKNVYGWRYVKVPAEIKSLEGLMQMYSPWLNKALGKQLWTEFAIRIPYWNAYVSMIAYFQLPVLESIFTNSSLTKEEKQQILLALSDHGYPANNSRLRYLQLVRQAYPEGNIPEYDFIKLNLCEMIPWQTPVTYPEFAPRIFDLNKAIADIKEADLGDLRLDTAYWQFKCSLNGFDNSYNRFDDNFRDVLNQTGLIRHFGYQSNYKDLFNSQFESLLVKAGIRDIEVYESVPDHKDRGVYKLYVRSNEAVYKLEFKIKELVPLYPQRLMKMINLLLMKKRVKERFIELESHYFGLEFGLFEPDKIKPLLDKYHVRCFAVGNGGELSAWGKVELKR